MINNITDTYGDTSMVVQAPKNNKKKVEDEKSFNRRPCCKINEFCCSGDLSSQKLLNKTLTKYDTLEKTMIHVLFFI
jgi:hypothetical protein